MKSDEYNKVLSDIKEINKKIDLLIMSDLLSKKIINEHRKRIEKLENK